MTNNVHSEDHNLSVEDEDLLLQLYDRLWVQYASFENFIQNHEGATIIPGLRDKIDKIGNDLFEVRQIVGAPVQCVTDEEEVGVEDGIESS